MAKWTSKLMQGVTWWTVEISSKPLKWLTIVLFLSTINGPSNLRKTYLGILKANQQQEGNFHFSGLTPKDKWLGDYLLSLFL